MSILIKHFNQLENKVRSNTGGVCKYVPQILDYTEKACRGQTL
jgi:hypothetical protein